jgi:hypothetical protein
MTSFFLACAALGGVVLLVQLALSLFGLGGEHLHLMHVPDSGHAISHDLQLFSLRALSAGVGFFGVGGLAGLSLFGSSPVGVALSLILGVVLGFLAMVGVAAAVRAFLRLDDDGSVRIDGAVGVTGDVYLTIPRERTGVGKVHLTVQNRIVEYQAVTTHPQPLPTGARVLVVDVVDSDTVAVVPDPFSVTSEVSNVAPRDVAALSDHHR